MQNSTKLLYRQIADRYVKQRDGGQAPVPNVSLRWKPSCVVSETLEILQPDYQSKKIKY